MNSERFNANVIGYHGMLFPTSQAGKITIAILIVFTVAMNPPVIMLIDTPILVAGVNLLYLWTVVWGLFISVVFIWAARHNAFALTEDQVPPELRNIDEVTTRSNTDEEHTTGGQ